MDGQKPSLCIPLNPCQEQLVHLDHLGYGRDQGHRSDQDSEHCGRGQCWSDHGDHLLAMHHTLAPRTFRPSLTGLALGYP